MLNADIRKLYDLGFSLHLLGKKSKVPLKNGWQKAPRLNWRDLEREFKSGEHPGEYNLGVRTGDPLEQGGYLANIDVDVKSGKGHHLAEALAVVEKIWPGVYAAAPIVATSYGLRLFVRTSEPLESVKVVNPETGKPWRSDEPCKVFMPSTPKPSDRVRPAWLKTGLITEGEIEKGYRIRPAWEVEFMSRGRQVVLPPSTHPETGKPYTWKRPLGKDPLPVVAYRVDRQAEYNTTDGDAGNKKFTPVEIDVTLTSLSDKIVNMILACDGVDDRSAACLTVSQVMVRAGFSDDEILSVLTDKAYALAETAYAHAGGNVGRKPSRERAAQWVERYCLRKARAKADPKRVFAGAPPEAPDLDDAAAAAQASELTHEDWTVKLRRGPPTKANPLPAPLPNVENTILVLQNELGEAVFRRNELTTFDHFGVDTPWPRGKTGDQITDDSIAHLTVFIGRRHRFEPSEGVIEKAIKVVGTTHGYHPVKDEFDALPAWDGKNRLDTWLVENFGARVPQELIEEIPSLKGRAAGEAYLAQVFRKWLVASVTRTYQPGEQFDWMPIFQGGQGTGKSSLGRILFGKRYHNDRLPRDLNDKDAAIALEGMRVAEWGELANLRKGEIDEVKAFITRINDRIRRPYGHYQEDRPRQVVFYGTTNQNEYLRDDSGNRRFMPVEVNGKLDFAKLERDREQLWAEALFIYQNGLERSLFMEGDAAEVAEVIQKSKLVADESSFFIDPLRTWLDADLPGRNLSAFQLEPLFLANGPLNDWRRTVQNQRMAAKALRELGAEKYPKKGRHWWRYPAKSV